MASDIGARVRAKFPLDEIPAEVWAGTTECESCGRETRFVSGLEVGLGKWGDRFSLAELGEYEGLFDSICKALESLIVEYRIARRPSLARGRWCLSNGCTHCGAFIGEYEDFDQWADKEKVHAFRLRLDENWRRAMIEFGDESRYARARKRQPVAADCGKGTSAAKSRKASTARATATPAALKRRGCRRPRRSLNVPNERAARRDVDR